MGKRNGRSTAVQTAPAPAITTAIQSAPPPAQTIAQPPLARPSGGPALILYEVLSVLASLRLTVWLFALSLLLIFFGTLAQMDEGIFTVLHTYFRTWFTWIPWQLFVRFGQVFLGVSPTLEVSGAFPFPGGKTLGVALLVNILSAHAVRFKISWKRSGVLILHAGIIIMMLGEFVAGEFQTEGRMQIEEGQTANFTDDYHKVELAFIDSSDPKQDKVVVVPGRFLKAGDTIHHELLPFDVVVKDYMPNSSFPEPAGKQPNVRNPADHGDGLHRVVVSVPPVSGTKSEIDVPAAYVELKPKDGSSASLGTYLVSAYLQDSTQSATAGDKTYQVLLRFAREYRPFSLKLLEFQFDRYEGTGIAKNYSSKVLLNDPEQGVKDREILIRMNEPLRYRGEAFFQADFNHQTEKGTVLQVVRNPGWQMPYISCFLVAVGMIVHFIQSLVVFLLRRFAL
jgi:hypothetical protein